MDRRAFLGILTDGVPALPVAIEAQRPKVATAVQPAGRERGGGSHRGLLQAHELPAPANRRLPGNASHAHGGGVVTAPTRANSHRGAAEQRPFSSSSADLTDLRLRDATASSSAAQLAFPAVAWFGRVDPEGLLEAPPARRGDDYGVAALHPFYPAKIEAALRDRDPYRTRDVWASLGPIEAESAEGAAGRTQCGKLDPELGEKTGACGRDFSDFVVEHDVFAGHERIGEIDAEAARKVVVANSGRTERACMTG